MEFSFCQVLTTHYILDTLNPNWEKGVEFFVADFTQVHSLLKYIAIVLRVKLFRLYRFV